MLKNVIQGEGVINKQKLRSTLRNKEHWKFYKADRNKILCFLFSHKLFQKQLFKAK